jgi:hypothetical protein
MRDRAVNTIGATATACRAALVACVIALVAASGCGGNDRNALAASSAISFTLPDFYLPPGSSLAWRSDVVYLFEDNSRTPENITPYLQQEIQSLLEARGYRFTSSAAEADHGLVAVIVLGEGLTARNVLQEFRLTPSFNPDRRYEKGTIVVAIYRTADEKVMWRGAIQANVDLDLPPEERRSRIREHAGRLLGKIPDRPPE